VRKSSMMVETLRGKTVISGRHSPTDYVSHRDGYLVKDTCLETMLRDVSVDILTHGMDIEGMIPVIPLPSAKALTAFSVIPRAAIHRRLQLSISLTLLQCLPFARLVMYFEYCGCHPRLQPLPL
jgi:hypothetical protein